jgi:parallel beta-helix repeat protein
MSTRTVVLRVVALLLAGLFGHVSAKETRVRPGQSIQAAIDAAKSGDRILVEAGTYGEYLTISKDGIHLVGRNAVIVQPVNYPPIGNGCRGLSGPSTDAAICIIGDNVQLKEYADDQFHREFISVDRYVDGVTVEGFQINHFFGLGVAVVGAKNTEIRGNIAYDNPYYGILSLGSKGSLITRNTIYASDIYLTAIGVDDKSDVHITQNNISDYNVGIDVQTKGADVGHNKVTNCCYGIHVNPSVDRAKILHNHIGSSNALCNPIFNGNATGILIDGATNTDVKHNQVTGTDDGGYPDSIAAGIAIIDSPSQVAKGNEVTHNTLSNNEQDLLVVSAGKNEVAHNTCTTPSNLCSKA